MKIRAHLAQRLSLALILILGTLAGLAVVTSQASADEGMWLFNAAPIDKIKARYGFTPTQEWLDHVRLSSVRFNNGGSGSFVSPHGLTFTNHHVGAECIQQLSTSGQDHMVTGFYAKTRAEEAKCPDLELNVLQSMEDVTDKVNAASNPDMTDAQRGTATRSAMAAIEKDCTASTGLRCDVITLYSGSVYHLYRYKKYTDVRLVFAPEFEMAFFGGDPDNFTYPRYDLDITFFRIYENDKPVELKDYFRWSPTGVGDNELVFVPGNPGSTGRLLTMSQLAYLRDVEYPWRLNSYKLRDAALKAFSSQSLEKAREAQEDIFGIENSFKAVTGYQSGLTDKALMAKKRADEDQLRKTVNSDPKLKAAYGDAWTQIDHAMQVEKDIFKPLTYFERRAALRGTLAGFARDLLRLAAEKSKPNGERLREYRDSALPSLEQELLSTAPIYKDLEVAILTESLEEAFDGLGRDNPILDKILAGKSPAQRARELIEGTKLDDVATRKQLYEGGAPAVGASNDPLIVLLRTIDPEARQARKRFDDEVDAVVRSNGAKIAKARFQKSGFTQPPDATFTLRLSYGAVRGYTENGKPIPYFTTMAGAFEHADAHGNKPPFHLPESWTDNKSKINLRTPLNFVHTADIIGGNSGSPTINQNAEVVGIVFDGNIQSLPWNFAYDDTVARSVSVDSRGIIEALRKVYDANMLADELTGGAPQAATKSAAKKSKAAKK
jgi:hypothetical protein